MNNLPNELLLKILSYTYEPQNKTLLQDIRDFHESKLTIDTFYSEKWNPFVNECPRDWIINDIFIFMNDHIPTMFGYCKKCKDIINRNPFVKNTDNFIFRTEIKHVDSQINIFLGLLTVQERKDFISQDFLTRYFGE